VSTRKTVFLPFFSEIFSFFTLFYHYALKPTLTSNVTAGKEDD